MKVYKSIVFLLIILSILIQPITVFADVINIDFFNSPTCSHCQNVKNIFSRLNNNISDFSEKTKINMYSIKEKEDKELLMEYYEKYSVPTKNQGSVPIVFIGDSYIIGDTDFENKFFKLYTQYTENPEKYSNDIEKIGLETKKVKEFTFTENHKFFLYAIFIAFIPLLIFLFIDSKKTKEQE